MEARKNQASDQPRHEHPLPQEISDSQRELNVSAFEEAMHDIDDDPDLGVSSPTDDLDEGETARLGEDKTDLV